MSSQKRVLITNITLSNYSGSEINAFELAQILRNRGWAPTIATFQYSNPMKKLLEQHGLQAVPVLDDHSLAGQRFDLAWVHHYPVFNYLLEQGVRAGQVIFSSLSSITPLETPPRYVNDVDLTLVLSGRIRETQGKEGLINPETAMVLPNSVREEFFRAARSSFSPRLQRLMVVSNHVPKEVYNAALLLQTNGIKSTFIGYHNSPVYLEPGHFNNIDAIVSIGRTVQYGLAMKIPVYCYDHFGGPGYITADNFAESGYRSFCGTCCRRKVDAATLANELVEGYAEAVRHCDTLQELAKRDYDLQRNVDRVLTVLAERTPLGAFDRPKLPPDVAKDILSTRMFVELYGNMLRLERRVIVKVSRQLLRRIRQTRNRIRSGFGSLLYCVRSSGFLKTVTNRVKRR